MKLRFLKFFILAFVVIFTVLNGRFVYANIKYWLLLGPIPIGNDTADPKLPLSPDRKVPILADQAFLKITSLGISAPIVFNSGNDLKNIYAQLENGVVHYSTTPKPGLPGVSVILGHSSAYPWYKGRHGSVFALLGKLKPGDTFQIEYSNGPKFTFLIKQSLVFSPFGDDVRLSQLEKTDGSSVILISCWPVGTNYKRIAVAAELI